MIKKDALYILTVLELSTDYRKREQSLDAKALASSRDIARRYEELTSTLCSESAIIQAQSEFLMSLNLKEE